MFGLEKLFGNYKPDKKEIAKILKTDPEQLKTFENAYKKNYLDKISDNLFEISVKQAAQIAKINSEQQIPTDTFTNIKKIEQKIIQELIEQTQVFKYTKQKQNELQLPESNRIQKVTAEDIQNIPPALRPQLTGYLMKTDIKGMSYPVILENYAKFLHEKNPKEKQQFYNMFRQGLDILDLDPIIYEMLGQNPNSIGYWLPQITQAVDTQGFFNIPETTIIKVPMSLLQLTRQEYMQLSPTTFKIINEYCRKVFDLKDNGNYFIKTGTYSSKFDFRNAHVYGNEIQELGQYLLYIHFQALSMAHYDLSGRKQPIIYGVSTTNEWCVREFIEDEENAPTIYNELPLHCEYRVFVDFDHKQVLAIHPYWDEKVMGKRFNQEDDKNNPKNLHDNITFNIHKDKLNDQYEKTKDLVAHKIQLLIQQNNINIKGQWSIDIMKNGNKYWLIDMALAQNSAYYEYVPEKLKNPISKENEPWLNIKTQKMIGDNK